MATLTIQNNILLAPHTTLGIGGSAEYFASVDTIEVLREAVHWAREKKVPITILGGGSNVLIDDKGIRGLVIHVAFDDMFFVEREDAVYVTSGAGKHFDTLVAECVRKNLWGLENLSGIPGTVGATPIQNVGAYGVEVGDHITSVVAYDMEEDVFSIFSNTRCDFSYRMSCFKRVEAKRYVVAWVTFKLTKRAEPRLSYNDLEGFFKDKKAPVLTEIRDAVVSIRNRKFPDWKELGTAGSFFKNPILSKGEFEALRGKYPTVPGFTLMDSRIKVPLGFILDKILGLKGYIKGSVGLYSEQALVLVNHGGADAREVESFAEEIITRVAEATGIQVEWEVTKLS